MGGGGTEIGDPWVVFSGRPDELAGRPVPPSRKGGDEDPPIPASLTRCDSRRGGAPSPPVAPVSAAPAPLAPAEPAPVKPPLVSELPGAVVPPGALRPAPPVGEKLVALPGAAPEAPVLLPSPAVPTGLNPADPEGDLSAAAAPDAPAPGRGALLAVSMPAEVPVALEAVPP
jgi:hypothetical protein